MNAPLTLQRTPCGRIVGEPLRDKRLERLAGEIGLGKPWEVALTELWAEGIRILNPEGKSFKSNVRRLRTSEHPEITERANELAAKGAELLGINAAWTLRESKLFAESSLAKFWARDETGALRLSGDKVPVFDFSNATPDDIRTLGKLKFGKYGPEIELRDLPKATQKIGEYFNLWRGEGSASATALNVTIMRFGDQTNKTEAA
jgi:hypothetical protein